MNDETFALLDDELVDELTLMGDDDEDATEEDTEDDDEEESVDEPDTM